MEDKRSKLFKTLFLISIIFIMTGLVLGDIEGLLIKSRTICYECIGVG